jgi:hypothetical protein
MTGDTVYVVIDGGGFAGVYATLEGAKAHWEPQEWWEDPECVLHGLGPAVAWICPCVVGTKFTAQLDDWS